MIPEISDKDLSPFQELICNRSGIHLDDDSLSVLRTQIHKRMEVNDFTTYNQYYKFLCFDSRGQSELEELLSQITVNETYFFRNSAHFGALRNEVLPKLIEGKRGDSIKIWSAGCSTGEEPYSVAMTILDILENRRDIKIEILGTDVDKRAITRAMQGIYRKRSLHVTEEKYRKRYFSVYDGGYRIDQLLKDMVKFECLNLMDTPYPKPSSGYWDIIVCRNVVIYFDRKSARHVIEGFHEVLSDSGYLLMGHSETLDGLSDRFSLVYIGDAFLYVKKDGSVAVEKNETGLPNLKSGLKSAKPKRKDKNVIRARKRDKTRSRNRKIEPIKSEPAPPLEDAESIYRAGLELFENEDFETALEKAENYIKLRPTVAKGHLLAGKLYANRGDYERAVAEFVKTVEIDPLLTEAHYLLGVIYQGEGQIGKATEAFRRSIYLDRKCVLPYFNLARIYQTNNMVEDALREYDNAIRILGTLQPDEIVQFSGGITARILTQTCQSKIAELSAGGS